MKRSILFAILLMGFVAVTTAQVDGKAIGLRFGNGLEASYWHPMGNANRIEADLGLNTSFYGLYVHGVYHWVNDLSDLLDGLNWYYGGGAALGLFYGLSVGIVGQAGVEYNFKLKELPLVASFDYRPALYLIRPIPVWLNPESFAVSIKYKF